MARRDFNKALEKEPGNSQIIDYLRKIEVKLEKIRVEAYDKMKQKALYMEL